MKIRLASDLSLAFLQFNYHGQRLINADEGVNLKLLVDDT